jgi:hypothetical protein
MDLLPLWQNFYVMVGSSGGALVGLQFVVIALIAGARRRAELETINAFGTPIVVHFSGALAISAVMIAPWPSLLAPTIALSAFGLGGLGYTLVAFRRARHQTTYKPLLEDWIWYTILPCAIYLTLATASMLLRRTPTHALFLVGAATLCLLFVGIRNAWDTITHLVVSELQDDAAKRD